MDQDTFTKLVQMLHHLHGEASEFAAFIVVPLLLFGAVCGFALARWVFRGGLSRGHDWLPSDATKGNAPGTKDCFESR